MRVQSSSSKNLYFGSDLSHKAKQVIAACYTAACSERFVPLPAVSMAYAVNVLCMRWNELRTGIEVYEKGGKVVGVSKAAAKQAVSDTTKVRAFLPIPMLLAPPCITPFLERYKWVIGSPYRHLFVNAIVCTLSFAFSLPLALALFPQESPRTEILTSLLEPETQAKTKSDCLFYNKGLWVTVHDVMSFVSCKATEKLSRF